MSIINFTTDLVCPCVDGIIYADGLTEKFESLVSSGVLKTVREEKKVDDFDLVICNPFKKIELVNFGLGFLCGGGSFEDDGFISSYKIETKETKWVIFSEFSEAFVTIEMNDNYLFAMTESNYKWKINIFDPSKIEIFAPIDL